AHAVTGCSLPVAPQLVSATVTSEALEKAESVRDAHFSELMAHPEVQAVGVDGSYDAPGQPAVVLFVTAGQRRGTLPATLDGVRTRIVEAPLFPKRGAVSAAETAELQKSAAPAQPVYPVSQAEMERARSAHAAHVNEWMSKPGVQGLGIG